MTFVTGEEREVAVSGAYVEHLKRQLAYAKRELRERPTLRQVEAVMEENRRLEEMNRILLARNAVLAREQRQRPAQPV